MRLISGIIVLVYILVGVLIANNDNYFRNVNELDEIVSAILAVLLWPLVLLNVDLHLGKTGDRGKESSVLIGAWILRHARGAHLSGRGAAPMFTAWKRAGTRGRRRSRSVLPSWTISSRTQETGGGRGWLDCGPDW